MPHSRPVSDKEALRVSSPVFDLDDMQFSPTAWLFEGAKRGGAGVSMFIVRTPPGGGVDLHVHPYHETFLLLEGEGRWTAGDEVVELRPNQMLVVAPETPHGFRNTGDSPLLVVSVHEGDTLQQTFLEGGR
jgi:mannose-6-phosphate isomerase-like protein (cupin superfamily)